jgi:GTP cyclohydrolase IA
MRSHDEVLAEAVQTLHNGVTIRSQDYVPVRESEEEIITGEMKELLQHITGVNFDASEHMQRTPERFVKMLQELTTPAAFEFTVFDNTKGLNEMITLYNIPFYTLCAHHVIPFFGVAHIGYVPGGSIAGLSKLPRAVNHFARGLNVQEELTASIADFLDGKLRPLGVAVVMEAEHLCMAMRGVQAPGVRTRTAAMGGVFADHSRTAKAEFLAGINGGK